MAEVEKTWEKRLAGAPDELTVDFVESLSIDRRLYKYDIVGSIEMSPCIPAVMIRQASEFLFDTLNWPNRPEKQPGFVDNGYKPM